METPMENLPKNTNSMKPIHLAILAAILVLGIVNVLSSFGVIGGGGSKASGTWEYLVLDPASMDNVGFGSIAKEDGKQADPEGKITLKGEDLAKDPRAYKVNLLPRTLAEVQKEGGWELVGVTGDDHYIFRRPKG